ncbi:MAG: hypothetical protein ACREF3_06710 [Acetobacteraceae bacterium]
MPPPELGALHDNPMVVALMLPVARPVTWPGAAGTVPPPLAPDTVKLVGYTVGALPSVPSHQPNQVPAVAGIGTYAPQRFVFTFVATVHDVGGTVADVENPN